MGTNGGLYHVIIARSRFLRDKLLFWRPLPNLFYIGKISAQKSHGVQEMLGYGTTNVIVTHKKIIHSSALQH